MKTPPPLIPLAASTTKAASKQTYYTIKCLVDRELIPDAYLAYAYFRWVDDRIDEGRLSRSERLAFIRRQMALFESSARRDWWDLSPEERMLVSLSRRDRDKNSGLHTYIRNMMDVMAFDAQRQGRWISRTELTEYARALATAVTEALHYFIGHNCPSPQMDTRYLAATAAHITHMLRDTHDDIQAGYFNVPCEYLEAHGITPFDMAHEAYRAWVKNRVHLARAYFNAGKTYLAQIENPRCRLAGYAYIARFEWVLDTVERDGFLIRPAYPERKSLGVGMKMTWAALSMGLASRKPGGVSNHLARRSVKPSEVEI